MFFGCWKNEKVEDANAGNKGSTSSERKIDKARHATIRDQLYLTLLVTLTGAYKSRVFEKDFGWEPASDFGVSKGSLQNKVKQQRIKKDVKLPDNLEARRAYSYFETIIRCLLSAYSTSQHGSFVVKSYQGGLEQGVVAELGSVEERSCQTRFLYIFPRGDSPTTDEAIANARNMHHGTRFIANISIDDKTRWGFGYAVMCIVVRGTAYR